MPVVPESNQWRTPHDTSLLRFWLYWNRLQNAKLAGKLSYEQKQSHPATKQSHPATNRILRPNRTLRPNNRILRQNLRTWQRPGPSDILVIDLAHDASRNGTKCNKTEATLHFQQNRPNNETCPHNYLRKKHLRLRTKAALKTITLPNKTCPKLLWVSTNISKNNYASPQNMSENDCAAQRNLSENN